MAMPDRDFTDHNIIPWSNFVKKGKMVSGYSGRAAVRSERDGWARFTGQCCYNQVSHSKLCRWICRGRFLGRGRDHGNISEVWLRYQNIQYKTFLLFIYILLLLYIIVIVIIIMHRVLSQFPFVTVVIMIDIIKFIYALEELLYYTLVSLFLFIIYNSLQSRLDKSCYFYFYRAFFCQRIYFIFILKSVRSLRF